MISGLFFFITCISIEKKKITIELKLRNNRCTYLKQIFEQLVHDIVIYVIIFILIKLNNLTEFLIQ